MRASLVKSVLSIVFALVLSSGVQAQYLGTPEVAQDLNNVVDVNRLPLRTQGRFIVDKDGNRVKLACVNWYQAHLSLHTVGGLNENNITRIVSRMVGLGFNCVRLVFSLELFYTDPPILDRAVSANPGFVGMNYTGMQMFDFAVQELAAQGLLIILNNHNSASGWCCDPKSEEGLWATSTYSTDEWGQALAGMIRRYKDVPQVVGMDLRNEIHDYGAGGRILQWGTSNDIDVDWKLASEFAARLILAENNNTLIFVSGICIGWDLRLLVADPPNFPIENRLVWTIHTYEYSMYWNLMLQFGGIPDYYFAMGATLVLVITLPIALILQGKYYRENKAQLGMEKHQIVLSVGSWFLLGSFLTIIAGIIWFIALVEAACQALNLGAVILQALGAIWLAVSIIVILYGRSLMKKAGPPVEKISKLKHYSAEIDAKQKEDDEESGHGVCCSDGCCFMNTAFATATIFIVAAILFWFSNHAMTYEIALAEWKEKWVLDKQEHPIWVGEFGNTVASPWFRHLIRLFQEYDLDWAYWSINGQRWYEETGPEGEWDVSTFGLLLPNYQDMRNPELIELLQRVQLPLT